MREVHPIVKWRIRNWLFASKNWTAFIACWSQHCIGAIWSTLICLLSKEDQGSIQVLLISKGDSENTQSIWLQDRWVQEWKTWESNDGDSLKSRGSHHSWHTAPSVGCLNLTNYDWWSRHNMKLSAVWLQDLKTNANQKIYLAVPRSVSLCAPLSIGPETFLLLMMAKMLHYFYVSQSQVTITTGDYKCEAENPLGSASVTHRLLVLLPPHPPKPRWAGSWWEWWCFLCLPPLSGFLDGCIGWLSTGTNVAPMQRLANVTTHSVLVAWKSPRSQERWKISSKHHILSIKRRKKWFPA